MPKTLKSLSKFVEKEAKHEGRKATKELAAFRAHVRLARQLLERRKELGLTQLDVAKRSGLPQSEVSRIESGAANPTAQTLAVLAKALRAEIGLVNLRRAG